MPVIACIRLLLFTNIYVVLHGHILVGNDDIKRYLLCETRISTEHFSQKGPYIYVA